MRRTLDPRDWVEGTSRNDGRCTRVAFDVLKRVDARPRGTKGIQEHVMGGLRLDAEE
jgi:hypothetical protein